MNDALYGGALVDPLSKKIEETEETNDLEQVVSVIRSRAKGYLEKVKEFDKRSMSKAAEAHNLVYEELFFLAGMLENNKIRDLEEASE